MLAGIAAVARNGVIGAGGKIPWDIPADLRRFRELTMGNPVIMGRKTFDSIGHPLVNRKTIVVTRRPNWEHENVLTANTLPRAIALTRASLVWIAGGGEIYREAWPLLDRLELTVIDQRPAGDVRLPPLDHDRWMITRFERHKGYAFVSYARR
jgi:dihydrofolate reductase